MGAVKPIKPVRLVTTDTFGRAGVALDAVIGGYLARTDASDVRDREVIRLIYDTLKIGAACFVAAHPRLSRVRAAKPLRSWLKFGIYYQRNARDREFTYRCLFCDADLDTRPYRGPKFNAFTLRKFDTHATQCACRWLIDRYELERAWPNTFQEAKTGYPDTRVYAEPGQVVSGELPITKPTRRRRARAT